MMEEKVYLFKNFRPETSLFQCLDMLLLALDFTSQKHDAVSYITTKTHPATKKTPPMMNSLSFYIIFVQRNHHLENPKTLMDLLFEGLWFNKSRYLGGLRKF
jgi:hypothetical protein